MIQMKHDVPFLYRRLYDLLLGRANGLKIPFAEFRYVLGACCGCPREYWFQVARELNGFGLLDIRMGHHLILRGDSND